MSDPVPYYQTYNLRMLAILKLLLVKSYLRKAMREHCGKIDQYIKIAEAEAAT